MDSSICRAFTFINYHIPLAKESGKKPEYLTIGHFDGLFTDRIEMNYSEDNLRALWKYMLRKTEESGGRYSYQNVFGFSEDSCNEWSDTEFWGLETDRQYPLAIVTFIQTSDYLTGGDTGQCQGRRFNQKLKEKLEGRACWYTYRTIDKNDFIICIKSKCYREAVDAIKEMHETDVHVVYSYSILSVNQQVLNHMKDEEYAFLYEEDIDSICLKGIANSIQSKPPIGLEEKYIEFNRSLVNSLYGSEIQTADYRIYDILGDNDFRLIARNVKLGRLLEQFAEGGQLNFDSDKLRFCLFSYSLILNTNANAGAVKASGGGQWKNRQTIEDMNRKIASHKCDELEKKIRSINAKIDLESANDKIITICRTVWQLLQSLKVLEYSPTKKYDFYSLYHPFALLVSILEKEVESKELQEGEDIYEFLHKISMTLNGTLRTDIQFYQMQDFNAIVHYAPAKLRAFYSTWAVCLSDYYNELGAGEHGYSFIFSPGLFARTSVKQLELKGKDIDRLMLIMIPERNLYETRRLSVMLAHEVSHFVGSRARKRTERHEVWEKISARVLELELESFFFRTGKNEGYRLKQSSIDNKKRFDEKLLELFMQKRSECVEEKEAGGRAYHSKESMRRIMAEYQTLDENDIELLVAEHLAEIRKIHLWQNKFCMKKKKCRAEETATWTVFFNEQEEAWNNLIIGYKTTALESVLLSLDYVCAEMFADIMGILTLGLTPEEYILSFNEELQKEQYDMGGKEDGLINVRVGIVIASIQELVIRTEMPSKEDFCDAWRDGITKEIIAELPRNSSARMLAAKAFGYLSGKRDCTNAIGEYRSIHDAEGKYTNPVMDFYNDKIVYQQLHSYTSQCAGYYVDRLIEEPKLLERQRILERTYKQIAGNSAVDMVREVETFLCAYEANWNEKST